MDKYKEAPGMVNCIYRRGAVDCTAAEVMMHCCDTCGWNPNVEEERIEKIYQQAGVERPGKGKKR